MSILSGDIRLLASQVMDDVPEGGGAPTSSVVVDGVSNAIFPDISELDRAGGRVNLRKLHVAVHTPDTDTYFGANLIVATPPSDPNVSVTLFSTRDSFDRRTAASSRVESYLTRGPVWGGMLLENHITGQRAIQLLQPLEAELPRIGQTLVLVYLEGLDDERSQYVRTTDVSAVKRKFEDSKGTLVDMNVVTCTLSDALRFDFPGSAGNARATADEGVTRVRDTTVADAGSYVGVVPLTQAAAVGDFAIKAASIYTQLVPSAQTETPLVDLKPNGERVVLSASGAPVVLSIDTALDTAHAISVGQAILPGSLSVVVGSVRLTDDGGLLVVAGSRVGSVDYANGLISVSDEAASYGGNKTVTYTPAIAPTRNLNTASWAVTAESRSGTLVAVFDPPPQPGSLTLSYRAQGRWYTLADSGNGQLRGLAGSSVGAGTVSFTSGSLMATLSALPDVGSKILATYGLATSETAVSGVAIAAQSVFQLAHPGVAPGTVSLSWVAGGVDMTATDDGQGLLTGDATGSVDYLAGQVTFKPRVLPSSGTEVSVAYSWGDPIVETFTAPERFAPDGHLELPLAHPNVLPRTVRVEWNTVYDPADIKLASRVIQVTSWTRIGGWLLDPIVTVLDDGLGGFASRPECAGVIDYAAGTVRFVPETLIAMPTPNWTRVSLGTQEVRSGDWVQTTSTSKDVFTGFSYATIGAKLPGDLSAYVKVSYRTTAAGTSATETFPIDLSVDLTPGTNDPVLPNSCGFVLGGARYIDRQGSLVSQINPATGAGIASGTVNYSTGIAKLTVLPVGAANSGTLQSLVTSQCPMPVCDVQFRTSSAPIRPSSLVVQFVMADDPQGGSHIATSDANGLIQSANVSGTVDHESGVVALYFGRWMTAAGNETQPWYEASAIVNGKIFVSQAVRADSIRYAAVAYSYLPLDANILGIDPVRLPSDGRVPIFRPGGFAVVGHTGVVTATVVNGQTIDCARVRLSRVRVMGADGAVIHSGYTADLEAGRVTFTDVAGYSQPVSIEHRIEDMAVVRDVQISGELSFTRPLTHHYPLTTPPSSFVSSALIAGDLFARVSLVFDQATWSGAWSDALVGSAATATFNDVQFPLAVTNAGAVTERWVLRLTSTTSFEVIGENVGVIATGNTSTDCAPINPATGAPYFVVPALGWGAGWSVGNVLRINTVGAQFPVWVVRTVQQGPESVPDDQFTLLIRGDVNR